MTEFINLTEHPITVISGEERYTIPPSGTVARVFVENVADGEINGIPVIKSVSHPIEGLPDPQEGKVYIVSKLVGARVENRTDVVGPNMATALRDKDGRLIAIRGFIRFHGPRPLYPLHGDRQSRGLKK